jgi:nitroreductase
VSEYGAMNDARPASSEGRIPAAPAVFHALVRQRRATRNFMAEEVPEPVLKSILEDATHAPSGYNLQPWRFLVLRTPEARQRLQQAAFGQPKIGEAPVVVVAFSPAEAWRQRIDEVFAESVRRGALPPEGIEKRQQGAADFVGSLPAPVWVTRQVMIAFTVLMFSAEAHGWDTAPMEGFDAAAVRREFELGDGAEVVALLAIGRAAEPAHEVWPGRFPVARVAFDENLHTPWNS